MKCTYCESGCEFEIGDAAWFLGLKRKAEMLCLGLGDEMDVSHVVGWCHIPL